MPLGMQPNMWTSRNLIRSRMELSYPGWYYSRPVARGHLKNGGDPGAYYRSPSPGPADFPENLRVRGGAKR